MNKYSTQKTQQSQDEGGVIIGNKHRTETLSVFLSRIRNEYEIDDMVPMTYAGRLDPMAEGLMIILYGEKCKEKDEYLGLSKTYTFDVLFGIETDTLDVLGIVTTMLFPDTFEKKTLQEAFRILEEKNEWTYPLYSSRTVQGKPLFMYARENIVVEEIPIHYGKISNWNIESIKEIVFSDIYKEIISDIQKVHGDFRQKEIIEKWNEVWEKNKDKKIFIARCTVSVSSGVYIRSIAQELGKHMGFPSLAYKIIRTEIGNYSRDK